MAKEVAFEVEGKVLDAMPNAMFSVELDNGHKIIAIAAGRLRKNFIRIIPGDRVKVEMSAYDTTKGRISFRMK